MSPPLKQSGKSIHGAQGPLSPAQRSVIVEAMARAVLRELRRGDDQPDSERDNRAKAAPLEGRVEKIPRAKGVSGDTR